MTTPTLVQKRNGTLVIYDPEKIRWALERCLKNSDITPVSGDRHATIEAAMRVVEELIRYKLPTLPTVEQIQDLVETALVGTGELEAARAYIKFRQEKARLREFAPIDELTHDTFAGAARFFPTTLQQFQFFDKYSRFDYVLGRRETWTETVRRAVDYLRELSKNKLTEKTYQDIETAILEMRVMPSMRLLAMAGESARRNGVGIYNCSYIPVLDIQAFVECLIISMSGCGVGFSVESAYVEQFPRIMRQNGYKSRLTVEDSAEGWAEALRTGLEAWFEGEDIDYDYSLIRPAGAPLKIKGGRASGPEPLRQMLSFIRGRFLERQGKFLRPLDAHDIMCAIGGAAVSGGVRRTALISLFDFDDEEMLHCKDGDFERLNPQRWNANNSAVIEEPLTQLQVMQFMGSMVASQRGEPGIFSRYSARKTLPDRRVWADFGTNPCGEILLRPFQFCNLSQAICRPDDTPESLLEKVRIATVIGTIQSLETNFPGLRPEWVQNAEEERLLGVDLNGQMDCPLIRDAAFVEFLKRRAIMTNEVVAEKLGINPSASITCVKPNGNSSQLLNTASGLHPRWSPYYIRNVRVSAHSPLYHVLKDAGAPMDPENGQTVEEATTWVIHFPVGSPEGAWTRHDVTAITQLHHWFHNKTHWTEHNPSCTITYEPNEVLDVVKWVFDNQDMIGGLSFLPKSDAMYAQMPYQEITKAEYERLVSEFPPVDFSKVVRYEHSDLTNAAAELACVSGYCEV